MNTQPDTIIRAVRTVRPDGTSYGGFRWPMTVGATVHAPDWTPSLICGGGLHGFLMQGQANLLDWSTDAVWMIVDLHNPVELAKGKLKAPAAEIVAIGTHAELLEQFPDIVPDAPFRAGTESRKAWEACCAAGEMARNRAAAWIHKHPGSPGSRESAYRLIDAMRYFADGYGAVEVVSAVTRGAPKHGPLSPEGRAGTRVEIRPARSGSWGKSRDVRYISIA
jgi:hypothetical protein